MDVEKTINAIENLINSFKSQSDMERLHTFSAIKTLLQMLREFADRKKAYGEPIPNVNVYISEMITPLNCLANIDDNGFDESHNFSELRSSVQKLRSIHCFDVG